MLKWNFSSSRRYLLREWKTNQVCCLDTKKRKSSEELYVLEKSSKKSDQFYCIDTYTDTYKGCLENI